MATSLIVQMEAVKDHVLEVAMEIVVVAVKTPAKDVQGPAKVIALVNV